MVQDFHSHQANKTGQCLSKPIADPNAPKKSVASTPQNKCNRTYISVGDSNSGDKGGTVDYSALYMSSPCPISLSNISTFFTDKKRHIILTTSQINTGHTMPNVVDNNNTTDAKGDICAKGRDMIPLT